LPEQLQFDTGLHQRRLLYAELHRKVQWHQRMRRHLPEQLQFDTGLHRWRVLHAHMRRARLWLDA
jgi:hypothetical protein